MRYLITTNTQGPFFTNWFDSLNHFSKDVGMVVYDLVAQRYTTNGIDWREIEEDSL
jgi:hypothetical protein